MGDNWVLPAFIGLVAGICIVWYFVVQKPLGTLSQPPVSTYRAVAENEEKWEVHRDSRGRCTGVTVHRSVHSVG